ncbi:MAG: hypothetical protein A2017_10925 [Lentisphaerae bacterium GWF2_44_16]|nr:MAG: hypothetical protein A2017_10925 [Lentisphaerae bacterium GWF2_44_16]
MKIIISFATEDFVTPEHDEVLLRLTSILSERGITGSFHLTGELARKLRERRRTDVIDALKKHEIGYHSNTHGAFPFIGEVCENNTWDDAVSILMSTEAKGILDIIDIFDRRPGYYVTEFIKAPQLIYALRSLGIDTIGYSNLPNMGFPFSWYTGSICFNAPNMGIESPPLPGRLENLKKEFDGFYSRAEEGECDGVVKMFNHPYKFIYNNTIASWVGLNNIYKKYDIHADWITPQASLYDKKTVNDLFIDFESIIDYALSQSNVEFLSTTDLTNQYRKLPEKFIDMDTVIKLSKEIRKNFTYINANGLFYSPSEIFGMLLYALKYYSDTNHLPETVPYRDLLGPLNIAPQDPEGRVLKVEKILAEIKYIDREAEFYKRMPSYIEIDGIKIPPGTALCAFAELTEMLYTVGKVENIPLKKFPDFPKIAEEAYFIVDKFTKASYPDTFTGRNICTLCKLQSWTYKPGCSVPKLNSAI